MKSWHHHFILGLIIGVFSVILLRALAGPASDFNNDSNLLVTLFLILAYGIGTTIAGELLTRLSSQKA